MKIENSEELREFIVRDKDIIASRIAYAIEQCVECSNEFTASDIIREAKEQAQFLRNELNLPAQAVSAQKPA